MIRPILRLKTVAICIRTLVRLKRAFKTKNYDILGEFGLKYILRNLKRAKEKSLGSIAELSKVLDTSKADAARTRYLLDTEMKQHRDLQSVKVALERQIEVSVFHIGNL